MCDCPSPTPPTPRFVAHSPRRAPRTSSRRSLTVLEEAGAGLSGGERRRLGLARGLLKRSPLYVFDEVTSDLDSVTEARLVDDLFGSLSGSTLIMIAHRLVTVVDCDRIYVVDGGRIAEEGTHQELVDRGGTYAQMWALQRGERSAVDRGGDLALGSSRELAQVPDQEQAQDVDTITYR